MTQEQPIFPDSLPLSYVRIEEIIRDLRRSGSVVFWNAL